MENISSRRKSGLRATSSKTRTQLPWLGHKGETGSSTHKRNAFRQTGVQGHSWGGSTTDIVLIPIARPQNLPRLRSRLGLEPTVRSGRNWTSMQGSHGCRGQYILVRGHHLPSQIVLFLDMPILISSICELLWPIRSSRMEQSASLGLLLSNTQLGLNKMFCFSALQELLTKKQYSYCNLRFKMHT